jgi:hypothetical protein
VSTRPVRTAVIRLSSGQWMTKGESGEALPVMVVAMAVMPFVMTAAPVPSVMMTTAPVSMTVMAVSVAVPDLDHGVVLGGQRGHAQPGGRGQGHCQRSHQRRADHNDTPHAGVLPIA